MPVQPLSPSDTSALEAAPLSYSRPSLADVALPPGWRRFEVHRRLRRQDLDGAATDLLRWRMHERAGLRVAALDRTARPGTVVLMRLGRGPFSLWIPCRVVEVFDEPRRRGFAYGTLPGHPEAGEERFVLEQQDDGAIRFTIAAVSRPASLLSRLGGPVSRAVQDTMTRRYLSALDQLESLPPQT